MTPRFQEVWKRVLRGKGVVARLCTRVTATTMALVLANLAYGQDSRFQFDANGNLLLQTSATSGPPVIISQPQMQIVAPGELASFFVLATDPRGLAYQWRFKGTNLAAATQDVLLLSNVSTNSEGPYTVVLSNSFGSVTSAPAALWIDTDDDGLPDTWERMYFSNLTQTATGDADNDGISNLQEFLDGTNPTNSINGLFRITVAQDGGLVQATPAQDGYAYGQVVTLTASAISSESFHGWTGDALSYSNSISLVMTNNKSVVAHFAPMNFFWTNITDGNWQVAANWSPNLVPGSNDNVVITTPVVVSLNTNAVCANFTLGVNGYGPTLSGNGTLTLHGDCAWLSGTMNGTGRTIIASDGTLSIGNGGTIAIVGRTLENGGTVTWTGTADFALSGGAVITNRVGGIFNVQNQANFVSGPGPYPRIDNAGTFVKSGSAGTTAFGFAYPVPFNNYGTVDIQSGGLAFNIGSNNGTITVPSNTSLSLGGFSYIGGGGSSITGAGTVTVNDGATSLDGLFNISGTVTIINGTAAFIGNVICTNNTLNLPAGTVTFSGTGTIAPAVVNLTGGTLDGTMDVTVGNSMGWTAGGMTGTGRTIIPPGVTLSLSNSSTAILAKRTLENGGTINWTGTADLGGSAAAVITNRSGALINVQNSQTFQGAPGVSPRLDNAGTFRKSVSAGTTTFGFGFGLNNYGLVDIQSGTLAPVSGGYNAGSMLVGAGTVLNLGNFGSSAASSIAGSGAFVVSGNVSTLDGMFNVSGTHTIIGTVTFIGTIFCTNNTLNIPSGSVAYIGTGTVAPAVVSLAGGTLDGTMDVTVGNSMSWTAGSMTGTGRTIIPPGVTLSLANSSTAILAKRTLENGGTINWTGTADLNGSAAAVITNRAGALLNVRNSQTFQGAPGVSPRIDNAGMLRKSVSSGTTTFGFGFGLNNYGLVDIQSGTLAPVSGGYNAGSMLVGAGTVLNLGNFGSSAGSGITGAGDLIISGNGSTLDGLCNVSGAHTITGGPVTFIGTIFCTNNTVNIPSGSVAYSGAGTVSPAVLNLTGGTLDGSMVVTVGTAMSWTGGTMSGTGRTVISPGVMAAIANPAAVYLAQRTLENGGSMVWAGAGSFNPSAGAVITNRLGALFSVQNSANFVGSPGAASRFDNAGIFRKSGSAGTTVIAPFYPIVFNNYGTVDIQSGILLANGGYSCSSNSVLNCAIWGTTPGGSYGQLQVSGTVNLNGTLSINLTNNYVPETNDTFTVLTAGTRAGVFSNFIYPSNNVALSLSNGPSWEVVRVTGVTLQPPGPLPAPSGIISWWRAENDALDSVSTNHGYLTNGAAFAAGKIGQSFNLDGINDYVVIADSTSLRPASVTLEAWVKIFSTNGIQLIFAKPIGSATLDSYGLALQNGVPLAAICDASGFGTFLSSSAPLPLGQWYHLAFTFDGSTRQQALYVNGAMVSSGDAGRLMAFDNHPLLLGADIENGVPGYSLNGQIDEAAIYNRALGLNEIASIYNVGSAGKQLVSINPPILHLERTSPTGGRLYWATNYPDFHLEYNTSLTTSNWAAWVLPPVIQGTNFIATNSFLSLQKYYRLSRVPAHYTSPPPTLKIERASSGAIRLLWPAEDERIFLLQSNTNLGSTNWAPVTPVPAILGGINAVTNATSEARKFYRLSSP